MTDDQYEIDRVLAGDRDAFRALIERHQSSVFATIAVLCARGGDAEDVAQEVFLAAFRHLATFDAAKGSFRSWILAIARHRCRSAHERSPAVPIAQGEEPIDDRTPERLASQAECFERLDAGLAALPDEQRLAFVLVELQGLSYQEAAELADVSVGTIKSRLFRAKQWLRETLQPIAAAERDPAEPRPIPGG